MEVKLCCDKRTFSIALLARMKTIFVIFLLVAAICGGVVEPKKYLQEVFGNLKPHLLAKAGTVLQLKDFEGTFNASLMSKVFNGTANFHSGFVTRIGKLELNDQKFRDIWNDTDVRRVKSFVTPTLW